MRTFNSKTIHESKSKQEGIDNIIRMLNDNREHIDDIVVMYTRDDITEKDSVGAPMRWFSFLSFDNLRDLTKSFRMITDEFFNMQGDIIQRNAEKYIDKTLGTRRCI